MDPTSQNQTSFIPRKAPGRESTIREAPVNIFLVLTTIIFVIAVLGSIGVFLYKFYLNKSIESKTAYLDQRREFLEPATINELIKTDKRLQSANDLLAKHVAITPVFSFLESVTLKTVRLGKFEYVYDAVKGATVKVSGEAKSYGSVALQADTFNRNSQFVKSAVFSNLDLDEKGNVTFGAVINFDPDLTNYNKALSRTVAP